MWAALQPQLKEQVVRLKLGTCNEELSIGAGTADWCMHPWSDRADPATFWCISKQSVLLWSCSAWPSDILQTSSLRQGEKVWGASVSTSEGQRCCKPDAATGERHQLLVG